MSRAISVIKILKRAILPQTGAPCAIRTKMRFFPKIIYDHGNQAMQITQSLNRQVVKNVTCHPFVLIVIKAKGSWKEKYIQVILFIHTPLWSEPCPINALAAIRLSFVLAAILKGSKDGKYI